MKNPRVWQLTTILLSVVTATPGYYLHNFITKILLADYIKFFIVRPCNVLPWSLGGCQICLYANNAKIGAYTYTSINTFQVCSVFLFAGQKTQANTIKRASIMQFSVKYITLHWCYFL